MSTAGASEGRRALGGGARGPAPDGADTVRHYLPQLARIGEIIPESEDTRTFVLVPEGPATDFNGAAAGQFVMLSVFGRGEAAFTLSSLPRTSGALDTVVVTVRRVGTLTGALFELRAGALVGVRGPFGRGFPEEIARRPTVYVAGGCGLSPLKAAVESHIVEGPRGIPAAILYGTREPATRIHRVSLAAWRDIPDVHVIECVEHADREWRGRVGPVATFLGEAVARISAEHAAVCGPPAMLPVVARQLARAGLDPEHIHIALERYMKCGTGHCGHCYVNQRYVCMHGPVFSFAELLRLPDAFPGASSVGAG